MPNLLLPSIFYSFFILYIFLSDFMKLCRYCLETSNVLGSLYKNFVKSDIAKCYYLPLYGEREILSDQKNISSNQLDL